VVKNRKWTKLLCNDAQPADRTIVDFLSQFDSAFNSKVKGPKRKTNQQKATQTSYYVRAESDSLTAAKRWLEQKLSTTVGTSNDELTTKDNRLVEHIKSIVSKKGFLQCSQSIHLFKCIDNDSDQYTTLLDDLAGTAAQTEASLALCLLSKTDNPHAAQFRARPCTRFDARLGLGQGCESDLSQTQNAIHHAVCTLLALLWHAAGDAEKVLAQISQHLKSVEKADGGKQSTVRNTFALKATDNKVGNDERVNLCLGKCNTVAAQSSLSITLCGHAGKKNTLCDGCVLYNRMLLQCERCSKIARRPISHDVPRSNAVVEVTFVGDLRADTDKSSSSQMTHDAPLATQCGTIGSPPGFKHGVNASQASRPPASPSASIQYDGAKTGFLSSRLFEDRDPQKSFGFLAMKPKTVELMSEAEKIQFEKAGASLAVADASPLHFKLHRMWIEAGKTRVWRSLCRDCTVSLVTGAHTPIVADTVTGQEHVSSISPEEPHAQISTAPARRSVGEFSKGRAEADAKAEEKRIDGAAKAKAEHERIAAEAKATAEQERIAAEAKATAEHERIAAEAEAKAGQERIAAEAEAKAEQERIAAEAKATAEQDRIAAEEEDNAADVVLVDPGAKDVAWSNR
jgi:hypothetical protein